MSNEDCDDGLFCNGREQCVSGSCQPALPPCQNPDAANCEVTCTEGSTSARCVVQGKDADGDKSRTHTCAQARGDDCDDSRADLHPKSKELCDGIDNDCDQKIDLADGLSVSGSNQPLGTAEFPASLRPSVVWSPQKKVYGTAWVGDSSGAAGDLYFESFDQKGKVALAPRLVNQELGTRAISLAWGGDRFGVAWVTSHNHILFRQIATDGTPDWSIATLDSLASTSQITPMLARAGLGSWGLLATSCGRGGCGIEASTLSTAGVVNDPGGIARAGSGQLVSHGQGFVVAWENFDTSVASGELRDKTLAPASGASFELAGNQPILGAGPSGFAIATRRAGSKPLLATFAADGSKICEGVDIGETDFIPSAVAGTKQGFLITFFGAVHVQLVTTDCRPGAVLDLGSAAAGEVRVAGGDEGYAVVWEDKEQSKIVRRVFGTRFCD